MRQRPTSLLTAVLNPQLSLFVVFEKKVGLIRIVNSAVGEVVLFEEPASPRDASFSFGGGGGGGGGYYGPSSASSPSSTLSPPVLASLSGRRSRTSLDGFGLAKDNRGAWTLPAKLELPATAPSPTTTASSADTSQWDAACSSSSSAAAAALACSAVAAEQAQQAHNDGCGAYGGGGGGGGGGGSIYIVTRGKQSFALPCPLPANLQATAPFLTIFWRSPPTFVVPRLIDIDIDCGSGYGVESSSSSSDATTTTAAAAAGGGRSRSRSRRRVLQFTAFGEDGLEIQETPLASLFGRERLLSRAEEQPVVAEADIGETGFLCGGGHWHRPFDAPLDLSRSYSVRSGASLDSMATEEVISRLESDQGIYGWQRKGLEDWRVFWIGGVGDDESRTDND
jgi:hypothetical protein